MSYFDIVLFDTSIGSLTGVGGPFEPAPLTSPTRSLGYMNSRRYPNTLFNPPAIALFEDFFNNGFVRYNSIQTGAGAPGNVQITAPFTSALGMNVNLYDYVIDLYWATEITISWTTSAPGFAGQLYDQDFNYLADIESGTPLTLAFDTTPGLADATSLIVDDI